MNPGARSLIVRLDLSERCNLRCTMCYFRDGAGTYDMPAEVWERVAAQLFPLAHTVHLSCGAEPMMSRHFVAALERAHGAGVPAVRLISNGTLLNEKNARALVDNHADLVVISLDGATPETYEHIRVGARWEKVLENIRRLQAIKREQQSDLPRVMLAFVVQRANLDEIPAFLDLAHELGVREVQFQELVLIFPDMEKDAIREAQQKEIADRVMDEARRKADEYGITLFTVPTYFSSTYRRSPKGWYYRLEHFAVRVGRGLVQRPLRANWLEMRYRLSGPLARLLPRRYIQRCFEPWRTVVLHANGEVVPCSLWHGGPMGSLQAASFAEIWGGAEYRTLRAELESGKLREGCRACPAYSSEHRYRIN